MPFLYLHGLGQGPAAWRPVLDALPPPYQSDAVCPSLSQWIAGEAPSYAALSQGFSRFCEQQTGPLRLCGLSLGAVLALHYAQEHPERVASLVLIAGQARMPKGLLRLQDMVFRLLPEGTFSSAGLSKGAMRALTRSMAGLDLTQRLPAVTCPALVTYGARDRVNQSAARTLAAGLPHASLHQIPGAGHEVNTQAPQLLADLLARFYQAHT